MPKVKLVSTKGISKDKEVLLHNADLVVVQDNTVYMVTSWIDERSANPQSYCSLINLSTGAKAFSEPSSRSTTLARILRHLQNINIKGQYMPHLTINDFYIVDRNDYELEIDMNL